MKKLIFLICMCVSGCALLNSKGEATEENYQALLNTWIGKDKQSLIERWGTPTHDYEIFGKTYVMYFRSRMVPVSAENQLERMPDVADKKFFEFSEKPAIISLSCHTEFLVEDNIITAWRFEGNDCKAYGESEKEK